MFPLEGKAFHDRMIRIATGDNELPLAAVAGSGTIFGFVNGHLAVVGHGHTIAVIRPAPTEADHLVVFRPAGKRIVGRMNDHRAAAILDKLDEGLLDRIGPLLAVVIAEHDLILGKIGLPFLPARISRRSGRDIHGEQPAGFKLRLVPGSHPLVVMIVLAIDDQDADFRSFGGARERTEGQNANKTRKGGGAEEMTAMVGWNHDEVWLRLLDKHRIQNYIR